MICAWIFGRPSFKSLYVAVKQDHIVLDFAKGL